MPLKKSPLDPSLLVLGKDELAFYKAQTGIDDAEQLREHILRIQAEAYESYPYPCVRRFQFTKLAITKFPCYDHVLQLPKSRKKAIFLDLGCCFGHDIRAIASDGYPMENIVALDLSRGLWDFGLQLFNSAPRTFPVTFVEGDIFDSATFDMKSTLSTPEVPSLLSLGNSLTGLRNHLSAIHISMVFHLFLEDKQFELAQRLGALLSPQPGSIIFGRHVGLPVSGIHTKNASGLTMFCHSPESWRTLWETVIFEEGTVEVDAKLVPSDTIESTGEEPSRFYGNDSDERWRGLEWLVWSVKRL
ncbi:hypothetical protein JB92DRAFT_872960 [Gautieria morchelliformis]|nr:hypothetical protein JB92DRAFT_872960 [Gautieria morchelliformis]